MRLPRFIRNFFERKRKPVDYAALHRFAGNFELGDAQACVQCGLRFTDPTHLCPTRVLTLESVARRHGSAVPLEGSLSSLAMAVFDVEPSARIYEDARHPFVVFIELAPLEPCMYAICDEHVATWSSPPGNLEALRRAVWWVKPMGVLVIVIGRGTLTYTAEDADLWLKEGK